MTQTRSEVKLRKVENLKEVFHSIFSVERGS